MNEHGFWESATAATLVIVVVLFAAMAAAQNKPRRQIGTRETTLSRAQSPARSQSPGSTEQGKPDGSQSAGIRVHGHWSIVIKNPDGSIASRSEFENSLVVNPGNSILSKILGRQASVGTWDVVLDNLQNPNQAVCASSPVGAGCYITEPSVTHIINGIVPFPNLTVQVPTWGVNANAGLVLAGTAQAAKTGTIALVSTILNTCASSISPATCTSPNAQGQITQQSLTSPISVQAGQSIDVTVILSFT